MGRGSSKITGSYVRYNIIENRGASSNTVQRVEDVLRANANDSRSGVREALDQIREGQKITTYKTEYNRNLQTDEGTAENIVTWTKMDDGTWRSDNGRRLDNGQLARQIYNGSPVDRLVAGEISTESHLDVPSKGGRTIDGLKYVGGTYDVQIAGTAGAGKGARKYERKGNITTYNGTMYGATFDGGEYTITHIPTGLSVGAKNVKNMKDVSSFIRSVDKQVKTIRGLDEMEERFKKTIRGD